MAVFAIADLHLSLGDKDKAMDIFPGWDGYVKKLEDSLYNTLNPEDTLIVAGDFSWGMSLKDSLVDFKFLDKFPGKKILLKGNHDYYWSTVTKMNKFLLDNNISSISFLHNNAYDMGDFVICGTRGWVNEKNAEEDKKIVLREAQRLTISINEGKKHNKPMVCFIHYPPIYLRHITKEIIDVISRNSIKKCYYGHMHGSGKKHAFEGKYSEISFELISADYLNFLPVLVNV